MAAFPLRGDCSDDPTRRRRANSQNHKAIGQAMCRERHPAIAPKPRRARQVAVMRHRRP
jgi:hypothetical protein